MSPQYTASDLAVKRRYASPHRERQAAETRQRILAAAHDLFSDQGYVNTTIEQIALAAGVARPTVFTAVGNKRQIMKLVRDVALAGDEQPIPVPQRDWMRRVFDATDPRRAISLYAGNLRSMYERAAVIELTIEAAADADPEIRDLYAASVEQRKKGCRLIVTAIASKGPLREGLVADSGVDILFALASPAIYRMLVHVCRWPPERYESWLADTLINQLLPEPPEGEDGPPRE